MDITIKQIESFLVAAQTLSFTQAAEQLFLSPSTISRDIRHLEKELGFDLFYRTTFSIQLTSAGDHMVQHFQEMLQLLDKNINKASKLSQGNCQTIHIGLFSHVLFSRFYEKIFKQFEREQPHIQLTYSLNISHYNRKEPSPDIIIAHDILPFDKSQYETLPLLNTKMFILCSSDNSIAKRGKLIPEDLSNQTLYTLFDINGFSSFQKKIFKNYPCKEVKIEHADDIQSVLIKLRTNHSFMLVDEYTFVADEKEFFMIPMSDENNIVTICAHRKKRNENHSAEILMNYMNNCVL